MISILFLLSAIHRSIQTCKVIPSSMVIVCHNIQAKGLCELDSTANKDVPLCRINGHLRPLARSSVPSPNRQQGLQHRVLFLKFVKSPKAVIMTMVSITAFIPGSKIIPGIICHSLPGLVIHVGKPVAKMSAEVRIDVINIKTRLSWPVESPGTKVAHHSLCIWIGCICWTCWTWPVSRFVSYAITEVGR